ncbi:DUF1934 domain-containing protein [Lederbergia citrea]|uniref:DUF1934 domain-containing protein n=1 Tax=Lederbergia citrea TaxID=2833581 RepID=UPI001BC9D0C4|nr:DUF1934 domain-containing protein [Lederbergia citrea]MBS4178013.1 DUF1934 domain-containing protein [Lederbergia citrea]
MKTKEDKRRAKIKLATTIRHPDQENETYELWAEGSYVQKQGQSYLMYEEIQEEGNIRTTVRMGEDEALILRGGAIKMRLPLSLSETLPGSYDGGFGSLSITTKTHNLLYDRNESDGSGRFLAAYDLLAGDQLIGEYKLEFTYTEEMS